jgi:hypothetical protein
MKLNVSFKDGRSFQHTNRSEMHASYLGGELSLDKKTFVSNTPITGCRDNFLKWVHYQIAAKKPSVQFLLINTKDKAPSAIPRFFSTGEFPVLQGFPVPSVTKVSLLRELDNDNVSALLVDFPAPLYLDPVLFWIMTEDFRKAFCNFSKTDANFYKNTDYSAFRNQLNGLVLNPLPHKAINPIGVNSPYGIISSIRALSQTLIKYIRRSYQESAEHCQNLIENAHITAELLKETHPNISHIRFLDAGSIDEIYDAIHRLYSKEVKCVPNRK